ncbi:SurA N-terminal domain-containing protein [Halobacillus sp. A5]|uniref:SurA N-terminal domain-containing protein n=1 Tax=Halobacillus sp. A5 TaxID=2880263 RepID=UPI0020A6A580|nr:SurA N-terminal domain-containing protein [Halobacillus sp. A5]MCP3028536.1 SurA N-terminal domain-containing protein [Halobacillus sp. A5]
MNKKWLLSLLLAAFVMFLAACNSDDSAEGDEGGSEEENTEEQESGEGESEGEGEGEQAEMPEPDLEDVPDVVAEVNGEEIQKDEFETTYESQFQQMAMQSQMSGEEVDQDQLKEQTAESLVGQELLIQEAENEGYEASEEDIDETLDELAQQNQLESKDEFLSALEEQGMSEDEVMSQLEAEVKVEQLVASEAGDIEPTEEELEEAYEQMEAQQEQMGEEAGGEMPSYEDAKPDLEEQVKTTKESEVTQKLVEELREEGDVTVHL